MNISIDIPLGEVSVPYALWLAWPQFLIHKGKYYLTMYLNTYIYARARPSCSYLLPFDASRPMGKHDNRDNCHHSEEKRRHGNRDDDDIVRQDHEQRKKGKKRKREEEVEIEAGSLSSSSYSSDSSSESSVTSSSSDSRDSKRKSSKKEKNEREEKGKTKVSRSKGFYFETAC